MGGYRINNPLNIIISDMLIFLLFSREHHNILNNHSNYSIFLTIILFIFSFGLFFIPVPTIFSYVALFLTIKAFSSFLKLRSISWLWPTIEFSIIRSSASTSALILLDKSLILCIVYITSLLRTSSLKIKSRIIIFEFAFSYRITHWHSHGFPTVW